MEVSVDMRWNSGHLKTMMMDLKRTMMPLLLCLITASVVSSEFLPPHLPHNGFRTKGHAGLPLPCPQITPSMTPPTTPPTSVHALRPSDVKVLSVVGLPFSPRSETFKVIEQFQELLSMFNPALIAQLPDGISSSPTQYRPLLEQVESLTLSLSSHQHVDPETDWMLLLLFVPVDRQCICAEQVSTSVKEVEDALQALHAKITRTIVSVVLLDDEAISTAPQQSRTCPCVEVTSEGERRFSRAMLTHALQDSIERHLVEKLWYSDEAHFTVQLQTSPVFVDMSDSHRKGTFGSQHTGKLALQLWENLLQPMRIQQELVDNDMAVKIPCPTEERPFLRTERNSPTDGQLGFPSPALDLTMGTELPCNDFSPSATPPTSVHAVRPADINVVAAVGDSLTAGNGVGASPNNLLQVLTQYRGLSWSVGGDRNLSVVTTLPNILREFNPSLTGFANGTGRQDTPQAFLNQAVAGAKSMDLPGQVRALINRMKTDPRIDFEADWKIITMFIGGNDVCDHCENTLFFSAENFVGHVRDALDILHREVPRAIVNLVETLHVLPLRQLHQDPSLKCPTWLTNILCPCVISPTHGSMAVQRLDDINRAYQQGLVDLVESERYDTHSNFTVVVQPFFRDIEVPLLDGRPDRSYFSPDCFHLSQKAHTLMARALWNNMLEPLHSKTHFQNFSSSIPIKCPSETTPFIQTYLNSNYTYKGPRPTPPPITNWGRDFSCPDTPPSTSVPTSVHKLRPADIQIVAALGDSITAAVGAKSKNILELGTEYLGVSWSIGGDKDLGTVTTLPNILKKFNPSLHGYAKGSGLFRQKGFNMAVPGARAIDIPAQVKSLIQSLKADKKVNFEMDWKLVTLFIGGNDLCHYCFEENNLSPQNYSHYLRESLDLLYNEVPRVMVNVLEVPQIDALRRMKQNTIACIFLPRHECPCVIIPDEDSLELTELRQINHQYQAETEQLLSGDRYEGRDDFAVVIQPYLQNTFVPLAKDGKPDFTYVAVDCFHLSERTHSEMALSLWNNMLEPVGKKQVFNDFTYDRSNVRCPSEDHPFIFTRVNSLPVPGPGSTAPPLTSSTPPPATPATPDCPPSVPVWVPVILAITGLLIGWAATWLLFSYRQRKTQKMLESEEKIMELKGTGL